MTKIYFLVFSALGFALGFPFQSALAQTPTPLPGSYPQPIFQQNIELVIASLVLFAIVLFGLIRFRSSHKT